MDVKTCANLQVCALVYILIHTPTKMHIVHAYLCVFECECGCECVCVCVRERARKSACVCLGGGLEGCLDGC